MQVLPYFVVMKPNNDIGTVWLFLDTYMTYVWQKVRGRVDIPVVLNVKVKLAVDVLLSCV
jgi:hypothetical protein